MQQTVGKLLTLYYPARPNTLVRVYCENFLVGTFPGVLLSIASNQKIDLKYQTLVYILCYIL